MLSEISHLPLYKARLFSKRMLRQFLSDKKSSKTNKFDTMDEILLLQCRINTKEQLGFKDILKILMLARQVTRQTASISDSISINPIYTDRVTANGTTGVYSSSVVVALYIRLVCSILGNIIRNQSKESRSVNMNAIKDSIYKNTKLKIAHTISPFEDSERFLSLIFKSNDQIRNIVDELFEWHYSFKNYVVGTAKINKIDYDISCQISIMTSHAWVAYTTFDSIIDKEIDSRFIPIANLCLHHMDDTLRDYMKNQYINRLNIYSTDILSGIVEELLVETNKGLFRDGTFSYQFNPPSKIDSFSPTAPCKSIGHCIGPILLLTYTHPKISHEEIKHFISFYKNLLSAKQLSDDAHDWETDMSLHTNLKVGRTNIKIKELIAGTRYTPVTKIILDEVYYSQKHSIDISNLRKIFTKIALPKILEQMQIYSRESERELIFLKKYLSTDQRKYWTDKVRKYEHGVAKAMTEVLVLEKLDPDIRQDNVIINT